MTELPHEVTEALAELARAAESYGRWCSPAHLHELRTARQSAEKVIASTLQSRRGGTTLQAIVDVYDMRSELFTSDEELATNLYDRARIALKSSEGERL